MDEPPDPNSGLSLGASGSRLIDPGKSNSQELFSSTTSELIDNRNNDDGHLVGVDFYNFCEIVVEFGKVFNIAKLQPTSGSKYCAKLPSKVFCAIFNLFPAALSSYNVLNKDADITFFTFTLDNARILQKTLHHLGFESSLYEYYITDPSIKNPASDFSVENMADAMDLDSDAISQGNDGRISNKRGLSDSSPDKGKTNPPKKGSYATSSHDKNLLGDSGAKSDNSEKNDDPAQVKDKSEIDVVFDSRSNPSNDWFDTFQKANSEFRNSSDDLFGKIKAAKKFSDDPFVAGLISRIEKSFESFAQKHSTLSHCLNLIDKSLLRRDNVELQQNEKSLSANLIAKERRNSFIKAKRRKSTFADVMNKNPSLAENGKKSSVENSQAGSINSINSSVENSSQKRNSEKSIPKEKSQGNSKNSKVFRGNIQNKFADMDISSRSFSVYGLDFKNFDKEKDDIENFVKQTIENDVNSFLLKNREGDELQMAYIKAKEFIDTIESVRIVGNLSSTYKYYGKPDVSLEKKTGSVAITFSSKYNKIIGEKFIRSNSEYNVSAYFHGSALNHKNTLVIDIKKKYSNFQYSLSPINRFLIVASIRKSNTDSWKNVAFYDPVKNEMHRTADEFRSKNNIDSFWNIREHRRLPSLPDFETDDEN